MAALYAFVRGRCCLHLTIPLCRGRFFKNEGQGNKGLDQLVACLAVDAHATASVELLEARMAMRDSLEGDANAGRQ